jgi:hypothetical protein
VSSMTNNTAPSAESANRFTFTWSIGEGTFVSWSEVGGARRDVCFAQLISRFALALATRISRRAPNLA